MCAGGQVLVTASSCTLHEFRPAAAVARSIRCSTACKLASIGSIIFCRATEKLCVLRRLLRQDDLERGIIMDISELLAFVVKNKASDLHLSSGLPPMIRVHGDIRRINLPAMEHKDAHAMVYDIMNDGQRKYYEEHLQCDSSFAIPNDAPFRITAFAQTRSSR